MESINELLFNQEKMKKIVKIEVKKEFGEQDIIDFIKRKIFNDIELDEKPFIKISEIQLIKIIKKTVKYYKEYEKQKEEQIKNISKIQPNKNNEINIMKLDIDEEKKIVDDNLKKINIVNKK